MRLLQKELDKMMCRGERSNNGRKGNEGEEGGETDIKRESGGVGRHVPKYVLLSVLAQSRLQTALSILDASPLVLHPPTVWQESNIVGQYLGLIITSKMWTF